MTWPLRSIDAGIAVRAQVPWALNGKSRLDAAASDSSAPAPLPYEMRMARLLGGRVTPAAHRLINTLAQSVVVFTTLNEAFKQRTPTSENPPVSVAEPIADVELEPPKNRIAFDASVAHQPYRISLASVRRAVVLALASDDTKWIDRVTREVVTVRPEDKAALLARSDLLSAQDIAQPVAPVHWPQARLVAALRVLWMNGARLNNVNLSGVNLRGLIFEQVDFTDAKLNGADFGQMPQETCFHLLGCTFAGVVARKLDLSHVRMKSCHWNEADLSDAVMHHASVLDCHWVRAFLDNVDLQYATIERSDFSWSRASKIDLRYGHSQRNNFANAEMLFALMSDMTLTDSRFAHTDIRQGDLHRADLRRNNFDNARLDHTNMEAVDLRGGSARNASLVGASVIHADLSGVPIDYEKVAGADFEGSELPELGPDIMQNGRDRYDRFILRPGLLPPSLDELVRAQLNAAWRTENAPVTPDGVAQGETEEGARIESDLENEKTVFQQWNAFFCSTLVLASGLHPPAGPPTLIRQPGPMPTAESQEVVDLKYRSAA